MASTLTASDREAAHQALLYDSTEEFVTATVPFVRSGLHEGHAVVVASSTDHIAAARDRLTATEATAVTFEDCSLDPAPLVRCCRAAGSG